MGELWEVHEFAGWVDRQGKLASNLRRPPAGCVVGARDLGCVVGVRDLHVVSARASSPAFWEDFVVYDPAGFVLVLVRVDGREVYFAEQGVPAEWCMPDHPLALGRVGEVVEVEVVRVEDHVVRFSGALRGRTVHPRHQPAEVCEECAFGELHRGVYLPVTSTFSTRTSVSETFSLAARSARPALAELVRLARAAPWRLWDGALLVSPSGGELPGGGGARGLDP
jgi:hypothetical protein